jgi:hypothetical protein
MTVTPGRTPGKTAFEEWMGLMDVLNDLEKIEPRFFFLPIHTLVSLPTNLSRLRMITIIITLIYLDCDPILNYL